MLSKNILIVEDDTDIRETLQYVFELEGYGVKTASNGSEALHMLEKNKPDLILLDLMMPVMNGLEFLEERRRRAHLLEIPVVVITAAGNASVSPSDISCLVRKPIELDHLLTTVKTFCK